LRLEEKDLVTEMRKKRTRRKKKKGSIFGKSILIIILLSAAAFAGYLYTIENSASSVISEGVYVENISLGGKSPSEAEALLEEKYGQPMALKKIQVQAKGKTYELDYNKLQAKYNIKQVVQEAFDYGKERNILEKLITKRSSERKDFKLILTYASKVVDEFVDKIEKETNKDAENAKITITNGEVKITPEVNGIRLKKDELKQAIEVQLSGGISKEALLITAPLEVAVPDITAEKLASANTRISSFSTNFSTSIANRISNIELATKAINGTILMPGETFSFNKTVGKRTVERGYKEAGIIIGDRVESGVGGGICQVSSTLYNAMLTANLKPLERRNHSLPLAYVSKGLDATVDWGNIDFRFKNTLNSPLYIEGYIRNKNVYFNIYSDKSLTSRTYQLATDVYETIQPSVKYVDDPNLNEGETREVKPSAPGYRVKVYRKTFEAGKLISTELISNDYYMPVNGEIARGTKKNQVKEKPSEPEEPEET
jgi:vancomycin resistance protein YoaR